MQDCIWRGAFIVQLFFQAFYKHLYCNVIVSIVGS